MVFTIQRLDNLKKRSGSWLAGFGGILLIVYSAGLPLPLHYRLAAWASAVLLILVISKKGSSRFLNSFTPPVWTAYFWSISFMVLAWTITTRQPVLIVSLGMPAVAAGAAVIGRIWASQRSERGAV